MHASSPATKKSELIADDRIEISVKGKLVAVPALKFGGNTIIASGTWMKTARIHDEEWVDTRLEDPSACINALKARKSHRLAADIFTFSQPPTDPTPRLPFFYELDSVAAIRILSYADWWNNRVSTDLRHDVRKAAKLGVVVRPATFDDDFVRGIEQIYDETPVRRGVPFWHYKKGFDAVKQANVTYVEKSDFLGAYWRDELVGFIKIVYVGQFARLMQIISKDQHRDKRPANALIAKAVEVCEAKGCPLLTYGKYQYLQGEDSLTAFKRRNGFEEILVPKYYVPLTIKGKLALSLRLQSGPKALLPGSVLRSLKRVRTSVYRYLPLAHKTT